MAKTKSAQKQARQSTRKNLANRSYTSKVKTAVKKFQASVQALAQGKSSLEDATKSLAHAQSFLMKASTKGIIHKNNASRHVARLARALAKTQKSAT